MGRKKGSKNRNTRKRKNNMNKTIGGDFLGGIVTALGLILFVLFQFANIGTIGDTVSMVAGGLFGSMKIAIPIVFIFTGIKLIISDERKSSIGEIIKGITFIIFLISFIYVCKYSTKEDYSLFSNTISFIKSKYNFGISGENICGIVGAIGANVFFVLGGRLVAGIILVLITLFFMLYFLDVSLKDFIYLIYNIFATIIEFIANAFVSVFSNDPEKQKLREERKLEKQKEKEEKQKAEAEKKKAIEEENAKKAKLVENLGTRNYASNITSDEDGQMKMDLDNMQEQNNTIVNEKFDLFKKQRETNDEKNVKEVLQLEHSTHEEEQINYIFPPLNLLAEPVAGSKGMSKKAVDNVADKLEKTLASFGVTAKVTNITKGPTVVCYELTPASGVKVSSIVNLTDDIALNLAAKSLRIEAPIPGKGTIGIEVPNEQKESVAIREVIATDKFREASSKLAFALGKDTSGDIVLGDIAKMPHVLVAGATGSGKSVCINTILVSILYKAKPNEVKLILIDPKMVELSSYNGIPHLLIPVVTDPKKAAGALNWAVTEMVDRYNKFASKGVKDIKGYNKVMAEEDEGKKLPQIVIIIDELADLMMVAKNDVEDAICRLAQMARAAGMHLVIATQRPSVDVVTGVIKANIPSRIAFTVSSQVDSRTILDSAGAEKLLGKGDMLYFPTGEIKPLRIQGAFVSEQEVEDIVTYIKGNCNVKYNEDIIEKIENPNKSKAVDDGEAVEEEVDSLLDSAIDMVIDMGQASASMLQRRFKIGYSRAGRMIDQMEARGIVSASAGSKPRQVLISKEDWQQVKMGSDVNSKDTKQSNDATMSNVIELKPNIKAEDVPSQDSNFVPQTESKPIENGKNYYEQMLMEKLKKNIEMESMFYDEDENSPNNT